jgi:hypothetical protein
MTHTARVTVEHEGEVAEHEFQVTEQGGAINLDQLTPAVIKELEGAYQRKVAISDAYNDAADAIAEKAGLHPSVLKAYIKARCDDKEAEHKEKVEQLQMLFDDLPTAKFVNELEVVRNS